MSFQATSASCLYFNIKVFAYMSSVETKLKKLGYLNNEDVTYVCDSEPKTMEHLLRCPLLEKECHAQGLAVFNDSANDCVQLSLKHNI